MMIMLLDCSMISAHAGDQKMMMVVVVVVVVVGAMVVIGMPRV